MGRKKCTIFIHKIDKYKLFKAGGIESIGTNNEYNYASHTIVKSMVCPLTFEVLKVQALWILFSSSIMKPLGYLIAKVYTLYCLQNSIVFLPCNSVTSYYKYINKLNKFLFTITLSIYQIIYK